MKPRPTLVLDTNIWISAFLAHGPPSIIVQMAEERLVQVFASLEMLDEIKEPCIILSPVGCGFETGLMPVRPYLDWA
jgi:hypothetical protein